VIRNADGGAFVVGDVDAGVAQSISAPTFLPIFETGNDKSFGLACRKTAFGCYPSWDVDSYSENTFIHAIGKTSCIRPLLDVLNKYWCRLSIGVYKDVIHSTAKLGGVSCARLITVGKWGGDAGYLDRGITV
jgi:hypothetical protein